MIIKIIAGLLVLALGAVCAAYLAADRETITAENFRDGSGYETASLGHGTTAFRTYGPVSAPAIIVVHGATLGSMTYQDYAAPFVAAGFGWCFMTNMGAGFPTARAPFSIDLMRAQLAELMDHLEIGGLIFTAYRWAGRLSPALPPRILTGFKHWACKCR